MRCYNHPEKEAIGTCKGCCKGLCGECATDLGHGLACKGTHEQMVHTYNDIVSRNAQVYSAAPKGGLIMPAFLVFMGLMIGSSSVFSGRGFSSSGFIMGAGFVLFGVIFFLYNRKVFGARTNA